MRNVETSIVIPTYNGGEWLEKTLLSCWRQSAPDSPYEVIVVDDGSTDKTSDTLLRITRDLPSDFLRVYHQDNTGPSAAINRAVDMSRGKNIIQVDHDDLLTPWTVDTLTSVLRDHVFATGGHVDFWYGTGAILDLTAKEELLRRSWQTDKIEDVPLLHRNAVRNPKAFKREEFEKQNGLSTKFTAAHDYELVLRLVYPDAVHSIGFTPTIVYWRRKHPASLSVLGETQMVTEAEEIITSALQRLGESKKAIFKGQIGGETGFHYYEHLPLAFTVQSRVLG